MQPFFKGIGIHRHLGPDYDFCRDADWWKRETIACSNEQAPESKEKASPLESEFNQRADRWERESAIHSSPGAKFLHEDYQFIMGKGEEVVPLILRRLETSKADWLWALEHIVGAENPARNIHQFGSAVQAWLEWGRRRYSGR